MDTKKGDLTRESLATIIVADLLAGVAREYWSAIDPFSQNVMAAQLEVLFSLADRFYREDYDLHRPLVMGKVKLEDFAKEFAARFNG